VGAAYRDFARAPVLPGTVVIRLSCITQEAPQPKPSRPEDALGGGANGSNRGEGAGGAPAMTKADRVRMKLEQRAKEREAAAERARTAASERLSTRPSTAVSTEAGTSLQASRPGTAAEHTVDEAELGTLPDRGRRRAAARNASDKEPLDSAINSAWDQAGDALTETTPLSVARPSVTSDEPLVPLQ